MTPKNKKSSAVLLITAFEPFGGLKTNASLILLEKLKKKKDWGGRVAFFGPLPVSYEDAWPLLQKEIARHPGLQGVLALGQMGSNTRLHLEDIAVNKIAAAADNTGAFADRNRVEPGGPRTLRSSFNWAGLEKSPHWKRSQSAGTYLCNMTMYHLLSWGKKTGKKAGFVHVPVLGSQFGRVKDIFPHMQDDVAVKSLCRVVDFALATLEKPTPAKKKNRKPR